MEKQSIHLRKVLQSDIKLIFEWANDKDARNNSFKTKEITWAEHETWFENTLKDLKTRLDEKDNEEKQKALRARVISGMKEKNATDDYVLKNCLKGVVFDDKKSVDELVNECLSLYDAEYKEARGVGSNPRSGGNGGGSKDGDIDAFFSEMKKRGKF